MDAGKPEVKQGGWEQASDRWQTEHLIMALKIANAFMEKWVSGTARNSQVRANPAAH